MKVKSSKKRNIKGKSLSVIRTTNARIEWRNREEEKKKEKKKI